MTATLPAETSARSARTARIPVAVLGATGSVGQRFVQLLENHPWFRLHEVVASERSAGKSYGDAADWRLDTLLPEADRKSTRLNSSHMSISYAVFCLKKKICFLAGQIGRLITIST